MIKQILVYQCPECKDVVFAKNWERHTMNYCKCKQTAVDFEAEYIRWIGNSDKVELKVKVHDLNDLLKGEDK